MAGGPNVLCRTVAACVLLGLAGCDLPTKETAQPSVGVAALPGLAPTDILVQYDLQGQMGWSEAQSMPFGHVPPLTLLADGTVIYSDDDRRIMQARLSPEQTAAQLQSVWDAGFGRIGPDADDCAANDACMTVSDMGTQFIRARDAEGVLRETRHTDQFGGVKSQLFGAIAKSMMKFEVADAVPYRPERATLFVQPPRGNGPQPTQDWPLARSWLVPLGNGEVRLVAGVLAGSDLQLMQRSSRYAAFEHDGVLYEAELVPWLPGQDHTGAIAQFVAQTHYSAPSEVTPTIVQTAAPLLVSPTTTLGR